MGKRSRKHRGSGNGFKKDAISYISGTIVEGFNYGVNRRNKCQNFTRVIFILFGCICSGWIFITAFEFWGTHPVETAMDEVGLPITQLPFPAITVCDTKSLKMPRKNRWMFIETLLNSLELEDPKAELKKMYPGNEKDLNYILRYASTYNRFVFGKIAII